MQFPGDRHSINAPVANGGVLATPRRFSVKHRGVAERRLPANP